MRILKVARIIRANRMNKLYKVAAFLKAKQIRKDNPEAFETIMRSLDDYPENKRFLYSGIIYDHFINNGVDLKEAIFDGKNTINVFERVKAHLENKDITSYKDYNELNSIVQRVNLEIGEKKRQKSNEQKVKERDTSYEDEVKSIENGDVSKIYEDDKSIVYRINNRDGARSFGKDTPWCITKDKGYFELYTSQNLIFYFVISKGLEKLDPLQKVAVRAIRDFNGNIEGLRVTKKTNDGDNNEIDIIPNADKISNVINNDAKKQPLGVVALIRAGKATKEQAEEYWKVLYPASYIEKESIIDKIYKKQYDIDGIRWFSELYGKNESELLGYLDENPVDAATLEVLSKVTNNQETLKELYKTKYSKVQANVARKTLDSKIITDAANSTYNEVKMGLVWNGNVDNLYIEHIRDNFQDDGNYFGNGLDNDKKLIKNRLSFSKEEEQEVINSKDPRKCYQFARNYPGANIQELQKCVLSSPEWSYRFAIEVPGANIQELQKAVLSSPEHSYEFARDIPGVNIQELQKGVLSSPGYSYEFARDIPGANVQELQKAVLSDPECSYKFAKEIPGANVQELQKAVLSDPKWSYVFARNVPGTNIQELQKGVLSSPKYSYFFVKDIPGANIQELQKSVLSDSEFSYLFAINIPGANILELQKGVLSNPNSTPKLVYEFASKTKGGNIQELQKAVLSSPEYSYFFAKDMPGANIQELQKAVLSSPKYSYFFVKDIPGANIQELQKSVLSEPHYSYFFAKDIPGANIQELQKGVLSDSECSYYFAKNIPEADKELLLEGVKNDPYYLNMYIRNILKITKEEYEEKYNTIKQA